MVVVVPFFGGGGRGEQARLTMTVEDASNASTLARAHLLDGVDGSVIQIVVANMGPWV